MNIKGKRRKNQVVNIFDQQEMITKAEVIKNSLKAFTWHELETNGKFDKNDKLTFISDDMLILGCDIDTRGRELSKSAFVFSNTREGFEGAKDWAVQLAAVYNKLYKICN